MLPKQSPKQVESVEDSCATFRRNLIAVNTFIVLITILVKHHNFAVHVQTN